MTITPDKTWEVIPVQVFGDVGAVDVENRHLLFGIKEGLLEGTIPWVVKSSCDAVSGPTAALSMSAATQANPCQITTTGAHGLTTGDRVYIENVSGMTELNDEAYTVTVVDTTNVTLDSTDATGYTAYTSGGDVLFHDDSDKWVDVDDVVFSTSAHSWIVLEIPGVSTTGKFQLLIDCDKTGSATETALFYISPSGSFFGGSTTARPTAFDELLIKDGNWGTTTTDKRTKTAYICKSTDGQCTRVYTSYEYTCYGFWVFDKAKNPISGWTDPWFCYMGIADSSPSHTQMFSAANFHCRTHATPLRDCKARGTTAVLNTAAIPEEAGAGDGRDYQYKWQAFPIGLDNDSLTDNKRLGEIFDLWVISGRWGQFMYLEGCGGAWNIVAVGNRFAQPGNGTTVWWRN